MHYSTENPNNKLGVNDLIFESTTDFSEKEKEFIKNNMAGLLAHLIYVGKDLIMYYIYSKIFEEKKDDLSNDRYSKGLGGFYLLIKNGTYEKRLDEIAKQFWNISNYIAVRIAQQAFNNSIILNSIKSGIAAIMARNMSHNLGSHVLAALTHEMSTMPDSQKLFQYIQQRMDFIAQITTEIPEWTYPVYIIQDLMRGFYVQKNLLNKIGESEGLKAFEFQNKNLKRLKSRKVK